MAATPLSVANLGRRVERAQPQASKPPAKSKPYKIMTIISSTELQTRKALNLINIGDCCCLCHENIQRRAGEQTFFDSSLFEYPKWSAEAEHDRTSLSSLLLFQKTKPNSEGMLEMEAAGSCLPYSSISFHRKLFICVCHCI